MIVILGLLLVYVIYKTRPDTQTFFVYNESPTPTSELSFYLSKYPTDENPSGKTLLLGSMPPVNPGDSSILETRVNVEEDSNVVVFYETVEGEQQFSSAGAYIGVHARKADFHLRVVEGENGYRLEPIIDSDLIPE